MRTGSTAVWALRRRWRAIAARSRGCRARVTKCMDEKTGEMLTMKNPCIVLEGVVCGGVYNASCPRQFVPFWREIWLERV